ncbi:MAG TPA: 2-isopropylmalate synthase [Firmicutes bacterium]|jgi:2-isopropylmalate synthase|nr:2-isopropylmalate synthase [Bacillota bacterium]
MKKERIMIFDSTLRDGEQTPGAKLNASEKLKIALQLARLNVDVIEAGFPISSPGDFRAVQQISRKVKGPVIAALARAVKEDIDCAWDSIKDSEKPRLHVFLAASDIHMQKKLRKDPDTCLQEAVQAVRYAKSLTQDVEYSLEDATRAREDYILRVVEAVIDAGATVVNIPDTVGYAVPQEFGRLIHLINTRVPNINKATISVHCHNDLGLAVINSLTAVENGARQIECNINGIGERAGNASLEEIVVAMKIREDHYPFETGINLQEIYRTSRTVSKLSGIPIPINKAVIGTNAFTHSSGIHQDGIIKDKRTYEIINAELIGGQAAQMVLTARSGRHAVRHQLESMGYNLNDEEFKRLYERFIELSDKKKEVYKEDLEALLIDVSFAEPTYELDYLQTISGTKTVPAAVVRLRKGEEKLEEISSGAGPIDAAYKAIDKITQINIRLENYNLRAVTRGVDALGEVSIKINHEDKNIIGRGVSTDIIEASVKAYLDAINKLINMVAYNNNNK